MAQSLVVGLDGEPLRGLFHTLTCPDCGNQRWGVTIHERPELGVVGVECYCGWRMTCYYQHPEHVRYSMPPPKDDALIPWPEYDL